MLKKLTVLVLTLVLFLSAHAETFIVTSNADSGPGSLREAIEKANANGTSVPDFIYFNIPILNFNARIINLETELPALTSNITIDGSTQPGAFYANTDAKICLKMDVYAPEFTMLHIQNATNVRIYSLNLYYGYWEGLFLMPGGAGKPRSNLLYGIKLTNANQVEIGAPGKGNVLNGFEYAIYSKSDSSRGVTISSNQINQGKYYENTDDEIDEVILIGNWPILFENVFDIAIGGPSAAEGNLIAGNSPISIESKYEKSGILLIQHNVIGKQKLSAGTSNWGSTTAIQIGHRYAMSEVSGLGYSLRLLDNEITEMVVIGGLTEPFLIQRNKFENQDNFTYRMCDITYCVAGGIIGGDDLTNANIFRGTQPAPWSNSGGVYLFNSGATYVANNIFECSIAYGSSLIVSGYPNDPVPYIQVDKTTSTGVSGRATPNSIVHIYYDDECMACEGKTFIATTMAGADSLWSYSGNITGTVVATSTLAKKTSRFSEPHFFIEQMVLRHPSCGESNGSVTGIRVEGADAYFWLRYNRENLSYDTVRKTLDLLNVGPGDYVLFGVHGGTCIKPMNEVSIRLEDISPRIDDRYAYFTQPSCNSFTGAIVPIYVYGTDYSIVTWQGERITPITNPLSFGQLAPGNYQLIVRDTIDGCADTANYVIAYQAGPLLNQEALMISPANCNNADGSITGIIVTDVVGTAWMQWEDSLGQFVSNSFDLENVTAGKYRFKFKDESSCDTIITPYYTIENRGAIVIDSSVIVIQPSSCAAPDGSISNLLISGAETYTWTNIISNEVVGTEKTAAGLAAGLYQLKASNSWGCTVTSLPVNVPQFSFNPIAVTAATIGNATCNEVNGFIKDVRFDKDPTGYMFRWLDQDSRQTLGTGVSITNLGGGNFILNATDKNGCVQDIYTAHLKAISTPVFDYSSVRLQPDECSQGKGGVLQLKVVGLQGPTSYTWQDADGESVGNNLALQNVPAGSYTLKVIDAGNCIIESKTFVVENRRVPLERPRYSSQVIPRNTAANLTLLNPQPGVYKLFDNINMPAIQLSSTGNFITNNLAADTTFMYVMREWGDCTSEATPVVIVAVDETRIFVPTGFTPNGDGRNDILKPTIMGLFEQEYFIVFDRWGNQVFRSQKQNEGWDGNIAGKEAPMGIYVWIIKGKDIGGKTVQQKGSFMLLR